MQGTVKAPWWQVVKNPLIWIVFVSACLWIQGLELALRWSQGLLIIRLSFVVRHRLMCNQTTLAPLTGPQSPVEGEPPFPISNTKSWCWCHWTQTWAHAHFCMCEAARMLMCCDCPRHSQMITLRAWTARVSKWSMTWSSLVHGCAILNTPALI